MLIFNIFFPVITGSNHGVGESTFLPLLCHLDQALARGEISLSRATPCKLRCLDSARHDRAGGGARNDKRRVGDWACLKLCNWVAGGCLYLCRRKEIVKRLNYGKNRM